MGQRMGDAQGYRKVLHGFCLDVAWVLVWGVAWEVAWGVAREAALYL